MNKSEKAAAKALLQFFGMHMMKWVLIFGITRALRNWAQSLQDES